MADDPVTPGFLLIECRDCEFDAVVPADLPAAYCPLCAADSGHDVRMVFKRVARVSDKPEGRDYRQPVVLTR